MLMDSHHTRHASLADIADFKQPGDFPLDFLQHRVPRIAASDLGPVSMPTEEDTWAPPGHGDIYLAMWLSGVLETLVEAGYRWAFVSNCDNLGATVDPHILAYLEESSVEFAMEVTPKTAADVKGGTLVRRDGRLTLLERVMVPEDHLVDFEDISRLTVFNTNNLWWNLEAVLNRLRKGALNLPLIVNRKEISGVSLVQLETAMGAAISCFDQAIGVRVSRRRFAPVKTTADLLRVRSDAYVLEADGALRPHPERDPSMGPPQIILDSTYYSGLPDFESRFAHTPGLLHCERLCVNGDVSFGRDVVFRGAVTLTAPEGRRVTVADGTVFADGDYTL